MTNPPIPGQWYWVHCLDWLPGEYEPAQFHEGVYEGYWTSINGIEIPQATLEEWHRITPPAEDQGL